MKTILLIVAGLVVLLIGVSIWWRRESRRRSLPCPAWLSGLLEVPYAQGLSRRIASSDTSGVEPNMRVLDVGCGAGRLSIPAARTVGPKGEVVAIDIQEAMLRKLNERIAAEGIANIRTVLGDITQIPIEGNGFDLALLVTVLGEIPDRQAALRAIFAALKPGGILCVTERIGDPHYLSSGTVLRLGESAGFCLNDRSGTWLAFTMNFRKPVKDSTMLFSPIADAGSTMISSNKA